MKKYEKAIKIAENVLTVVLMLAIIAVIAISTALNGEKGTVKAQEPEEGIKATATAETNNAPDIKKEATISSSGTTIELGFFGTAQGYNTIVITTTGGTGIQEIEVTCDITGLGLDYIAKYTVNKSTSASFIINLQKENITKSDGTRLTAFQGYTNVKISRFTGIPTNAYIIASAINPLTEEEAYQEGYNTGYNEGEQAGIQQSQYGIFNGATYEIEGTLNTTDNDEFTIEEQNIQKNLVGATVSIYEMYQDILTKYNEDPEEVTITINLKENMIYNAGENNLFFAGESLGWKITLIDKNGNQYSTSADDYTTDAADEEGNKRLNFSTTANGKEIQKIQINFKQATNTMAGYLMAGKPGYNSGYDSGYNVGYNTGKTDGYDQGEEIGYNNGYKTGYNEGYTKGNTDPYTFTQLLTSVIDAPVQVFSDMLNFEILGFNLLNVIVAILSIALVLKIISIFTKGK